MILAYVGGYDPAYPRNAVLRAGLSRLGVNVHALFVGRRMSTAERAAAIVSQVHRLDPAPDVVLVAEFCHQDVPAAWLAARRARAVLAADPFVSRVDTWGGEGARGRPGALTAWANRKWDDVAFRWPAVVVADTETHARRFAGAADRQPFPVVNVGADDAFFDLPDMDAPAGRFTVLYAGTFLPLHGVDTIVDAAERLAARGHGDIQFELVGDGMGFRDVRERVRAQGLTNVTLVGRRPIDELPQRMFDAHVVLGVFAAEGEAGRVIPNKVSQGLASGRCVVTGDHEAVRELLVPDATAVLVPPADPAALADALLRLRDDSARRHALAREGRALARRALTPEAVARQLLVALGARKIAQTVPSARVLRVVPTLGTPTIPAAPAGA